MHIALEKHVPKYFRQFFNTLKLPRKTFEYRGAKKKIDSINCCCAGGGDRFEYVFSDAKSSILFAKNIIYKKKEYKNILTFF